MLEERELIEKICKGETELFRIVIKEYEQKVAALCYKMGGNGADIEDLSQHVFVEVFKSLARFRFQCQLSTFIYKIAFNTIAKLLKKEKRLQIQLNERLAEIPHTDETEEYENKEERIEHLQKALQKINKKQQTALCLHVFENLSYKEIAASMEISVPAVESLIFRAKKSLHKILIDKI